MELINKWLPIVAILVGVYLVAHNAFDFEFDRGCGRRVSLAQDCGNPVGYFYGEGSTNGIGIGAVLVVAGSMAYFRKKK